MSRARIPTLIQLSVGLFGLRAIRVLVVAGTLDALARATDRLPSPGGRSPWRRVGLAPLLLHVPSLCPDSVLPRRLSMRPCPRTGASGAIARPVSITAVFALAFCKLHSVPLSAVVIGGERKTMTERQASDVPPSPVRRSKPRSAAASDDSPATEVAALAEAQVRLLRLLARLVVQELRAETAARSPRSTT